MAYLLEAILRHYVLSGSECPRCCIGPPIPQERIEGIRVTLGLGIS